MGGRGKNHARRVLFASQGAEKLVTAGRHLLLCSLCLLSCPMWGWFSQPMASPLPYAAPLEELTGFQPGYLTLSQSWCKQFLQPLQGHRRARRGSPTQAMLWPATMATGTWPWLEQPPRHWNLFSNVAPVNACNCPQIRDLYLIGCSSL